MNEALPNLNPPTAPTPRTTWLDRVRWADNAFGPRGRGMLGRESKPVLASGSFGRCAILHYACVPVYEQRLKPWFRGTIHRRTEQSDWFVESESDSHRGAPLPSFGCGRLSRVPGGEDGNSVLTLHYWRGGILRSRAICYAGLSQLGTTSRKFGSGVRHRQVRCDFSGKPSCIALNSTSSFGVRGQGRSDSECIVVVLPCHHCTHLFAECQ